MIPRITLILSVFCLSVQILFAQQQVAGLQKATKTAKVIHPTQHHYLSISFDQTFGMCSHSSWKNPRGVSFSYIISPAKRYKPSQYYIGLGFNLAGKSQDTPYSAPGIKNGNIHWSYSTLSFGLTQRYFFKSSSNAIPFIDLDLGWRTAYNLVDTDYDWHSQFLGYLPGGRPVYENQSSAFSAGLGAGFYFQVMGLRGPYVKLGLTTGNKSKIMLPDSNVTDYTNSAFISMSLGIMI